MEPTLVDGSFILYRKQTTAKVGDLVVANHPSQDMLIVKRLSDIGKQGFSVSSDNPAQGTDSRTWGPLREIVGVVTLHRGA